MLREAAKTVFFSGHLGLMSSVARQFFYRFFLELQKTVFFFSGQAFPPPPPTPLSGLATKRGGGGKGLATKKKNRFLKL